MIMFVQLYFTAVQQTFHEGWLFYLKLINGNVLNCYVFRIRYSILRIGGCSLAQILHVLLIC